MKSYLGFRPREKSSQVLSGGESHGAGASLSLTVDVEDGLIVENTSFMNRLSLLQFDA